MSTQAKSNNAGHATLRKALSVCGVLLVMLFVVLLLAASWGANDYHSLPRFVR